MKSKREPKMSFWMTLYGKDINFSGIEKLLHIQLDNDRIMVPDNLPENPNGHIFYDEIAWLLNLAEENEEKLIGLGVDYSDSQIWVIYYYDKQCNMEFDPDLMERIGKLGLKLCVSCQEI